MLSEKANAYEDEDDQIILTFLLTSREKSAHENSVLYLMQKITNVTVNITYMFDNIYDLIDFKEQLKIPYRKVYVVLIYLLGVLPQHIYARLQASAVCH